MGRVQLIFTVFLVFVYCGNCVEVFDILPSESLDDNPRLDEFCKNKLCLRRCCSNYQVIINTSCQNDYSSNISKLLKREIGVEDGVFSIVNSHQKYCSNQTSTLAFSSDDTHLNGNQLYIKELSRVLDYRDFCLEQLVDSNGNSSLIILGCFQDERTYGIQKMGMIISMPFLFITFLVYLILPDKNVHQKALMLYVLTLLLAYILLVAINLSGDISSPYCSIIAYGTLFLFMVSFFWMNVICFDIWYTFSGGRGYIGSTRNSERRRFLVYTAYAVGIPMIHMIVVYLLDRYLKESIHKPNIGEKKCFLDDGWPSLWYMYGEAGILVIMNVVFFVLTALKIRQVKKETSMLKQSESKRHTYEKDKRRFNLFLKLLLAMGVNWSMEVISWMVNWQTSDKYTYIWYITDFINATYGVVIFFIFVFKRKIWKMLQKRYYNFIGKPHLARAVTTTTETRTSHYSSTADTHLTDRTNISERRITNGTTPEEIALQQQRI